MILFLFLLAFAAGPVFRDIYPNKVLTPGATNPVLTKEVICSSEFWTGKYRNVPVSEKKKVFQEYGIPWSQHAQYEVDHLISLELGGSNDLKNLWPEAYLPKPGAHEKDTVENHLHKMVCENKMTLEEAQGAIADDWFKVYNEMKNVVH